jgi:GNAT superfamily N-acetyltransferase
VDDGDICTIRLGRADDLSVIISLFDEAIDWLVARDQTGQWGSQHAGEHPDLVARFAAFANGSGLRVAERDGTAEGVMAVGAAPAYVPAAAVPELYVLLLLTSRRQTGLRIGSRLIQRAVQEALRRGCRQLRVDCWAGAPSLAGWYEKNGYRRDGTFELNGWRGQILKMPLS